MTYAELVGPDKLVKEVVPVAGEDYTSLVFSKGARVEVRMADGRIIRYPLGSGAVAGAQAAKAAPQQAPSPAAQGMSIVSNLQILNEAAEKYYTEHDTTTTTYEQLGSAPINTSPRSNPSRVRTHRSLLFKKGHPLRLYLKDGRVVVFPPEPAP